MIHVIRSILIKKSRFEKFSRVPSNMVKWKKKPIYIHFQYKWINKCNTSIFARTWESHSKNLTYYLAEHYA